MQATVREMVYVGGGVGMAPLRAMIHQELGRGTTRSIRYLYGARSAADLFYAEEFEALAAAHENFAWTPVLSNHTGDRWSSATGFVHGTLFDLGGELRALGHHPSGRTWRVAVQHPESGA